ncbi:polysaccharide pyruvyl transferase CsaB [Natranaerobius trueperi]|uniref:Polysaccharide pyruvyl transferase CsaB n=1 Tax=Natranaerobius trueperi TaxID=759412 RepID=A0A226C2V7_9FIRM|nr:polysaccharide pyruvyl transferase CsaB [Natranaerobius trueperi]OWZ84964.1 polysaccharide pyruvyl transferase CsaB [Natranaerobius trueperi]
MGKSIVIHGYYGADNTGDEAILSAIVDSLHAEAQKRKMDIDITVLSKDPKKTEKQHSVVSEFTGRMFSGMDRVIQTIKNGELFISGGGGLLQDNHPRVVPYWLSRVLLAKLFKKPVVFYAQGVGPIYRPLSKILIRNIVRRVDVLTVRDEESQQVLIDLGITEEQIRVTADPAFALENNKEDSKKLLTNVLNKEFNKDQKWLGVSLRPWNDNHFINEIAVYLDEMTKKGYKILFIPMQYKPDIEVSELVRYNMKYSENTDIFTHKGTPKELLGIFSEMDINLCMRLHGAIFSMKSGVPTIGLSYQPKVASTFKRMQQENKLVDFDEITSEKLIDLSDKINEEYDDIVGKLLANSKHLADQTKFTVQLTLDCLY